MFKAVVRDLSEQVRLSVAPSLESDAPALDREMWALAALLRLISSKKQVYRIIDGRGQVGGHGRTDMPVWGDAFLRAGENATRESVEARIRKLVEFLDSIQRRTAQ